MLGPTIIYDKSALQSLSHKEAFWLSQHYQQVIVPLLYLEILADLQKTPPEGRTAEQVVADISSKIGPFSRPQAAHEALCLAELRGHEVEMDGRPIMLGGKVMNSPTMGKGIVFDQAPETEALQRWQQQDFTGVDRDFATRWRKMIARMDLKPVAQLLKKQKGSKFGSISEVKAAADVYLNGDGHRYAVLTALLDLLGASNEFGERVIKRWKKLGGPKLPQFAPYCAYFMTVELVFFLGLGSELVGSARATIAWTSGISIICRSAQSSRRGTSSTCQWCHRSCGRTSCSSLVRN
jgi:hypothetical protein